MDNSVIAKSGWLHKQTPIMKKWKKNWVELYRDGHLKYYENECSPNAEDVIYMPTDCVTIKVGMQVDSIQPPDGFGIQSLLSVSTSSGKNWIFSGESLDDVRAWQLALEQARLIAMHPQVQGQLPGYLPYNMAYLPNYPGENSVFISPFAYPQAAAAAYYSYPTPQYLAASSQAGALYPQERYYRPDLHDVPMGMLNSTPTGQVMWSPLLWW